MYTKSNEKDGKLKQRKQKTREIVQKLGWVERGFYHIDRIAKFMLQFPVRCDWTGRQTTIQEGLESAINKPYNGPNKTRFVDSLKEQKKILPTNFEITKCNISF